MKKSKKTLNLFAIAILFLSMPVLAEEGDTPTGGKTCPPPQTVCREAPADDTGIIKFISDFLTDIFG